MIDLHTHILPGLDDGAQDPSVALEMARCAVDEGVHTLAATPHVRDDYPTTAEQMERAVVALREAIDDARIPLKLLTGGEIALETSATLDDSSLRRFGLAGNPRYLLIEMPYVGWPLSLEQTLFQLRLRGFAVMLAHPERNREVQIDPARLKALVEAGTLVQVTAASIEGRLGRSPRAAALRLLELGYVHMLASDAHSPTVRQIGMSAARDAIGDPSLAEWLTEIVPGAIVNGEEIPGRPELRARRNLWPRRRAHS